MILAHAVTMAFDHTVVKMSVDTTVAFLIFFGCPAVVIAGDVTKRTPLEL
jgi:hypothetical protein